MWASLILAGFCYLLIPFLLPADAFTWGIYAVRGFVLLGTTLIVAFIVSTLATAQRREQTAVFAANTQLAAANRKLAQQTAVMEQLAISQERDRLARELHDTLAHTLSGTAVQLQAVGTLLKVNPDAAAVELAEAQQQIKFGLEESRRAIAALRATPLEELGLAEALRQRCHNLSERSGIPIHCDIAELPILPPLTEQTIYRVADEALLNAEKYAQASEISVRCSVFSNQVVLIVEDDGVGFAVERVMGNGHFDKLSAGRFGLIGMKERAELIGANLAIESEPANGTRIQLSIIGEPNTHHATRNTENNHD
jgi:signal transduction histidine kinase